LLLTERWLLKTFGLAQQSDLFNVVIQSGAVLAVLLIFTERLKQITLEWRKPQTQVFVGKLVLAFALTGVGGVVLKKLHFRLPHDAAPIAWATLAGGILFIAVEAWLKGRQPGDQVTWTIAIAIGISQLLAAVFPGLSRSGATILMALALGLGRPAATEFSFLLGIPTLLAAGGLEMIGALRHPPAQPEHWGMVALGAVVAAVTAFASVKWLLRFIQTHTFVGFGWYRIVVGGLILLLVR
jgi:undecaprenyl-diphosphatase